MSGWDVTNTDGSVKQRSSAGCGVVFGDAALQDHGCLASFFGFCSCGGCWVMGPVILS